MKCIKCSNEITDGAKFCPFCGASSAESSVPAPSAETEGKITCSACGMELMRGTKFCPICGGAAATTAASPTSASAVSLDKPSGSDELVSAMNSAASSVPTPAESGFGGVPAPNGSSFGVSAPSFAPSANAADMGTSPAPMDLPNYTSGAAVAVKPIKKKHKGRVALIIIAAVVVLLGAAAILFFTNRAAVLSTVMGKSKYAAMVEGTHIKKVTDQIDLNAVAEGIKSGTSAYQAVSSMGGANMIGKNSTFYYGYGSASAQAAPMMYGYGSSNNMEMDLSSIEKLYAEMLMSNYGTNAVNGSLKANIELGDSLKSMLKNSYYYYYYDLDQLDEVLDYVNGTTLTYNVAAKDDAMAFSIGTDGKLKVSAKVLMNGQDMYVSLPFASDKAIKLTFDKPADSDVPEFKPLEVDAEELERIIGDIIKIYLEHYKALEIEMEDGEISAAGVTVSGKIITAEFDSDALTALLEDVMEYLADDEYLASKIVEFANSCGADIDEDDYSDAILDAIDEMEIGSKDKLVITTVINRNGDVLGKTYEAVANKEKASVSYAETKEQSGVEIKADDVKITLLNEKENDENGSCTVKVTADGATVSLVLKYSDVKKAEFCGKEIMTGKFDLSMKLPNDFKDMLDDDAFAAMNGAKISLSIKSDSSKTLETTIALKANGYIDVSLTETVTALDDTSDLAVPSGAIDLTPLTRDEYIDDQSAEDVVALIKDVVKALQDMGMDIDDEFLEYIDPAQLTGKVSKMDIDDLLADIDEDLGDMLEDLQYYSEWGYAEEFAELTSLRNKMQDLSNRIKAKNYSMTQDEFDAFNDEYWDLWYDYLWL